MTRFGSWRTFGARSLMALALVGLLIECGPPKANPAPARRRAAASTTAPRRGATTPGDAVIKRAGDPSWKVRKEAMAALGKSQHPKAIDTLLSHLTDKHSEVRTAAEKALEDLKARAIPGLIRFYVSTQGKTQARAATMLDNLGKPALAALIKAYASAKAKGRRQIVKLVGRFIYHQAVKLLLDALNDPDHIVREQAVEALTRKTDDGELDKMFALLRTGRAMPRQHLLEVLGVIEDERVPKVLLATFTKTRTTVRRHNHLDSLLRHPGGYAKAVGALAADDVKLRRAMLSALAYEFTSIARVPNAAWGKAERGRFKKALGAQASKILKVLKKARRSKRAPVALSAAQVLKGLGKGGSTAKQEKAYIKYLIKKIKGLDPAKHADKLVVYNTRLGFFHWTASCKRPDALSLCISTRKVKQAGGLPKLVRTILKRNPGKVKKARAAFAAAWKAWAGGRAATGVPKGAKDHARRVARARHYAAWAKFMEAELELEDFLRQSKPRLKKPKGGSDVLKATKAQLTAWYKQQMARASKLANIYKAVMDKVVTGTGAHAKGSIYWRLASLSRVGTVFTEFAYQIMHLDAPKWLTDATDKNAFVEAYMGLIDRFELRAKKASRQCLQTAARERYFWDLALHCEAAYMTLDPEGYEEWVGERRKRLTRMTSPKNMRGVLTLKDIRHVIRSRRQKVQACFKAHLGDDGNPTGTLVIKFQIETNATVTVQRVSGLGGGKTERCVQDIYEKMRFPVGPAEATEASFAYNVQPGVTRIGFD